MTRLDRYNYTDAVITNELYKRMHTPWWRRWWYAIIRRRWCK